MSRPAAADDPVAAFRTLRDCFRHAVSRLQSSDAVFGHGATNALDEAAFIVLEALHLPIDQLDLFLDARLTEGERRRLIDLIEARIATRKPAAYLLNRTYIQGVPFHVDERVIVPRSLIGELLFSGLIGGEGALIDDPDGVKSVLDLCAGGGSLAILAARVFPNAEVDAAEISPDALAVSRRNVEEHGLEDRVTLIESDLFGALGGRRYDLILSNPPYVTDAAVAAFPPEYAAEPEIAHRGGPDGLAIARRILAGAPAHLAEDGALLCEVGSAGAILRQEFPDTPFLWLDTAETSGETFWLAAADFPAPKVRKARKRE